MAVTARPKNKPVRNISLKKLGLLNGDPAKTAAAVQLVYVTDQQAGLTRKKAGKGFYYVQEGKRVTDKAQLQRIKCLVIPPAWEKVWICASDKGHLQATGYDQRGRKQYLYHPAWSQVRNMTKFAHLYEFGLALPDMRAKLDAAIKQPAHTAEKVLATLVSILEHTSMRIGNNVYEQTNGSYGLTTLRNKHVSFEGSAVRFVFTGKKAVKQDILLTNKRLTRIVRQCHDMPGKELFQYYDEQNNKCAVDSGMVNTYIDQISGDGHFTAKDFRTWSGSLHALRAFSGMEPPEEEPAAKKQVVEVLDQVASVLGNTRSVCKKYYVHPDLVERYLAKQLPPVAQWAQLPGDERLDADEKALMYVLKRTTVALTDDTATQ